MTMTWITIAIFHLLSIGFMGGCIMRLNRNLKHYQLSENRHTMLFGFIKIEHCMLIYIFFIVLYTIGSMLFINFLAMQ